MQITEFRVIWWDGQGLRVHQTLFQDCTNTHCCCCCCCGGCFVIFVFVVGVVFWVLWDLLVWAGIQLFFCWCFGFGFWVFVGRGFCGICWFELWGFISYGASGSLEAIAERLELAIAGLYRGLHSRVLAICRERGENCFVVVSLSSFSSRTWTRTPCFVSWPVMKKKKKRRRIRFGSTFSEFFFCWVPPSVLFSQAFFSLLSGCGN